MQKKKFIYLTLAILVILCVGFTPKVLQNDTFYTIKIGQLILNNGIDMLDHFSWHNLAYTYPHWLYDVFIFGIYKISGFTGLYISSMILFVFLIFSIYYVNAKLNKNIVLSFFIALISILVLANFATARAQLVSFILFVWEFYYIEKFIETKNKRYAFGLLLISLLLCNIHVAVWPFFFVMFLPFVAEYVISYMLFKVKFKKNKFTNFLSKHFILENNKNIKYLLFIMLLSTLTGLITPIGTTPYTYFYNTAIGNSQNYILEHATTSIIKSPFVLIIVLESLLLILISKIKLRDLFMIAGLTFMSLDSFRHLSLFMLIGGICFARLFANCLKKDDINIDDFIMKIANKKIAIIIAIIIPIGLSLTLFFTKIDDNYIDKKVYPVEGVNYIKKNLDVDKIRLYNEYNFGSYLILNDIPVFIDSRADLYTKPFSGLDYDIFDDYEFIVSNYEQKLSFYKITHLLLFKSNALCGALKANHNYEILYEDKNFILFERNVINEK